MEVLKEDTCVYECAKLHKKVNKLFQEFNGNEILQKELDNNEKWVIRRFFYKELRMPQRYCRKTY